MIKATTKFSIHAIHVLLRNILISFSLLFGLFFIWITIGIKIDAIDVSHYQVKGLYIKLDKKLTLKADKITIPKSKSNASVAGIDTVLERIKYVLTFFDYIDLNEIHFNNNVLGIHYHNNIIQIESKEYLVRGNVHRKGKILQGNILMLYLKKRHITLHGTFAYHLDQDRIETQGTIAYKGLSGQFFANKVADDIYLSFQSKDFEDMKSLLEGLPMSSKLKYWLAEGVQAKSYRIDSFTAQGKIQDKRFVLDKKSIQTKMLFSDVDILFKKELAPLKASVLLLTYTEDDGVLFTLTKPRYLGKNLDGSSVSILNVQDNNSTLHVNLKFDTRFDSTIQDLLKAYKVKLPILQKSGRVKASVDIALGFKKKHFSLQTQIELGKGELLIQKLSLPIVSGTLYYKDKEVILKDIELKHPSYVGQLNGKVQLKKKAFTGVFDAQYIKLGSKEAPFFSSK
ncbi:MAG: DUF3971 domain-containing protein [Sulfurovum sp.]|nr:DUF3971 domain-containing protein [Sulfurovum sp.]